MPAIRNMIFFPIYRVSDIKLSWNSTKTKWADLRLLGPYLCLDHDLCDAYVWERRLCCIQSIPYNKISNWTGGNQELKLDALLTEVSFRVNLNLQDQTSQQKFSTLMSIYFLKELVGRVWSKIKAFFPSAINFIVLKTFSLVDILI